MITIKDCLDFSTLSEVEICAIADHAHEPIILSVAHGECLSQSPDGKHTIAEYVAENSVHTHKNYAVHHRGKLKHRHYTRDR
uniref:Uncharacterized protein n=1 Tax=Candidatus Berkiella cookevillensis TaxID=437022 RepID=A0A0Q9YQ86_9GAMM